MAEKIKTKETDKEVEKQLLVAYYMVGDKVELVSHVDPWLEIQLGQELTAKGQAALNYLQDKVLREAYSKEVKE